MLNLAPVYVVTVELRNAHGKGKLSFVPADAEISLMLAPLIKGEQGLPGFSSNVVAAEALGGHRVVTVDGYHANPEDADRIAGVTNAAGSLGASVVTTVKGLMTEGSWNWIPNQPIFIGANGVLTQNPSTSGLIRRIAWAISATQINVDFMPPILQT